MKDVRVDILTVEEFGKEVKEETKKLIEILDNMKKDTLRYEEMIDSKTGTLYKETMHKVLDKEKDKVEYQGNSIGDKFINSAKSYHEAVDKIKERVKKNEKN